MSIVMREEKNYEGLAANDWLVLSIGEIVYPETNSRVIIQQESLWGVSGKADSKLFEVR